MKQTPKNLIIIEKYEEFVNYTYPVLQNIPRKHGVVKERILLIIFEQVELFYKALKSGQKSKLYEADANLASIRFYLRFLANDKRKLISQKQHQTASIKLAEVGKILHSWIKGKQDSGASGCES
ncbi:MAG: diversity-generating retroelement protein Avd [Thiotrichales bacterium]|nr:diversity-generating retroelement protein Avd [Thiotrichales bacterium]